jgi:hypothetical protein
MMQSLSEQADLFYYLFQCILCLVSLLVITIGLPGQLLPGLAALGVWLLGWGGEETDLPAVSQEVWYLLGGAALAELVEFVSGWFGGQSVGATRQGSVGAMLGGFVGGILGNLILPIIGGIFGVLGGTFIGAYLGEKRALEQQQADSDTSSDDQEKAMKVGMASLIGRILGLMAKLAFTLVCLFYFIGQLIF